MASSHISGKIDRMGRLVLPIQILKQVGLSEGDEIIIHIEGEVIVVEKYHPNCVLCKSPDVFEDYNQLNVCPNCVREDKVKTELFPKRYIRSSIKKGRKLSDTGKVRKALGLTVSDELEIKVVDDNIHIWKIVTE